MSESETEEVIAVCFASTLADMFTPELAANSCLNRYQDRGELFENRHRVWTVIVKPNTTFGEVDTLLRSELSVNPDQELLLIAKGNRVLFQPEDIVMGVEDVHHGTVFRFAFYERKSDTK